MFDKAVSIKERFLATAWHIVFSLVLLSIALYLVYEVWYPTPLNIAMGVTSIYLMLLAIDLIVGPFLTFLVYKKDKKKLCFDLIVILAIQLSAFSFGLYILSQGRPVWQVFVIDDIELVSPIDLRTPITGLKEPQLKDGLLKAPLWIAAVYSDDTKIRQSQKEAEMFDGISLATRPETYHPLQVKSRVVLEKLQSVDKLRQFNTQEQVKKELHQYLNIQGWLPVKAPNVDMVAIFNQNGQPLGIVNLRPWNN
jgi:hypothetical protein